uniref:Uncharacterized protein n=1 Tax=Anopheles atroparvus TaxID=41427 RepID=A0AAG5CUS8_ANOAO
MVSWDAIQPNRATCSSPDSLVHHVANLTSPTVDRFLEYFNGIAPVY